MVQKIIIFMTLLLTSLEVQAVNFENIRKLSGEVEFFQYGHVLKIKATEAAIIEWSDMMIDEGDTVWLELPSKASRITISCPTNAHIMGSLSSNAQVIFNSSGCLFLGKNGILGGDRLQIWAQKAIHHKGLIRSSSIGLQANSVILAENSIIDCAKVGKRGVIEISNAQVIYIDEKAQILADAKSPGPGGKIHISAKGAIYFLGKVSAKSSGDKQESGDIEFLSPSFPLFTGIIEKG